MSDSPKITHRMKKTNKVLLQMNVYMDRIEKLMDQTDSAYILARDLLLDAKYKLDEPKKALKLILKAYYNVRDESKVAFRYNEVMDHISKHPVDGKKLNKLDEEYRASIKNGKYRKAARIVRKISGMTDIGFEQNHISIGQVSTKVEDGRILIVINSTADTPLTIERVSVTSKESVIEPFDPASRTLAAREQQRIPFKVVSCPKEIHARITVDYKLGFDRFTQTETLFFAGEASS